jgi:hypothetical protein
MTGRGTSLDELARVLDRARAIAERHPDDMGAQLRLAELRADYEAARARDLHQRNATLQRKLRQALDELRRRAAQVETFGALWRRQAGGPGSTVKAHGKSGVRRLQAAPVADLFDAVAGDAGRAA